jgi:phage tail tape-measure protein
VLKSVAKKALPFVGGALGSFIPIPGVGTALGSALGGALSKALELEYGELEQEDAEFEMARRFVRIASAAAQQAASAPPSADAMTTVNQALVVAARRHLPNADLSALARMAPSIGAARHSGRWIRRGGNIVVVGA